MAKRDKRTDAYIAKSAPFAKPILKHLRKVVHDTCPKAVEVTKWGMPAFDYHGLLCSMAAFKGHCTFGFWKAQLMKDPEGILRKEAAGHFGKITSVRDLPRTATLKAYLREAMALNVGEVKTPRKSAPAKLVKAPTYFMNALKKNKKALATYQQFSNTNKKDYVEWVTEAKTEETRTRRLETSIAWMAEGKIRNWKYVRP